MALMHLILALTVVVGMTNGKQLSIENPKFNGFIETRDDGTAVLFYQQKDFHGTMPLANVERIDIGYKRGKPYPLTVTLKDGKKLNVDSEHRNFLTIDGQTPEGPVSIKHPDPIAGIGVLSTHPVNRKHNLTIRYIEFPR